MKCPNCSFENSDEIKNCKVCGYELTPKVNTPKKRIIDESEEEALDTAIKSLFGHDSKIGSDDEDPLDVASIERMLKKKRPISSPPTEQSSDSPELSSSQIKRTHIKPTENVRTEVLDTAETSDNQPNRTLITIIIVSSLLVLLLVFFNSSLSRKLWKYSSDESPSENQTVESTEIVATEATTESEFTLGEDVTLEPINSFFNTLPPFVNQGNLSILSLFMNSQDALDVLTTFAIIGNVERISEASIETSEINEDNAIYSIKTQFDRLIDGEQKQVQILWDFRLVLVDGSWKIESFSMDSESLSANTGSTTSETTTAPQTTESPAVATTEATEATTEATTEAKLEGYIAFGGFSGGVAATGQDIASARYGNHQSYERIVFDIFEWIGGQPTTPAEIMTSYVTTISEDGKTIRITVNGALDAYADNLSLDLKGSTNIKSVQYAVSTSEESVTITIHLTKANQYKVFSLKTPAKLVVDVAPAE